MSDFRDQVRPSFGDIYSENVTVMLKQCICVAMNIQYFTITSL